jgi:oligosaccharyltransferase complex subunit alpha (ribophorin I)
MAQGLYVVSVIAALLVCGATVNLQPDLTVVNINREVDLRSQVVRNVLTIELENSGSKPVKEYLVALETSLEKQLAYLEANKLSPKKERLSVKRHVGHQQKDALLYAVQFGEDLKPGARVKLEVKGHLTHLLNPYPTRISQSEQQFVVYEGSAVVFAPQRVLKQKTVFRLSQGTVESYTKDASVNPVTQDGQSLTYGPYENVDAFSGDGKSVRLHFENNSPFLAIKRLDRLIELSHWGNIAVEETVDMVHVGAQLKGPFSRYDFQRDHRSNMPAIKSYKTMLPAAAGDVYYRDEIGNISTSHLRSLDEAVELDIRPRFPLFGGWKTHYVIGYNVPSYEYLYQDGSRFVLQIRFVDHIFDNFVADEATVRILLPERVKDVKVSVPFPVTRKPDRRFSTYLDYTGRPMVVLEKKNVVDAHIKDMQIEYHFERTEMAVEPAMLVAAFFLLFLVVIVYVRLDFTIAKDAHTESREKISGLLERVRELTDEREEAYGAWSDAIESCRQSREAACIQACRKKVDGDFKRLTNESNEIAAQVKPDAPEIVEKIQELQRLDKQIRDQLVTWSGIAERLSQGKANKQQYNDVEKTSKGKIDEWKGKMETIVYAL